MATRMLESPGPDVSVPGFCGHTLRDLDKIENVSIRCTLGKKGTGGEMMATGQVDELGV